MAYVNPIIVKDVTCTCPYFSHFEVQIYRVVADFPTEVVTYNGGGTNVSGDTWKLLPVSFRHTIQGRTYYIKVRCVDSFGATSEWSNIVTETCGDTTGPSKINTADVEIEYTYGVDSTTLTARILDTYSEADDHSHYEWYINSTSSFPSTEPIQKDKSRSLTYVVYDYPKYFFVAAVDKSGNYSTDYNTTVIASLTGLPTAPSAPHFNNVDYVISESGYGSLNNGDEYYAKTLAVSDDGSGFKSMASPIIVYDLYNDDDYFDHFEIQCATNSAFTTNLVVKIPDVRGSVGAWTSEPCSFDHCLHGLVYYFRVRAIDKFEQASTWAEDSTNPGVYYVTETAGDITAPGQITSSHVTIEYNGLDVFVSLSGYTRASDHDRIEWYHSTVNSWPSSTHPTAVGESGFTFSGLPSEIHYIFARAVDKSGNYSTSWNSNVGSAYIYGWGIDNLDISTSAHNIDSEKDKLWHFDGSAISNKGIEPVNASPEYTIRDDGIFGKSIVIEEGTTNLIADEVDVSFDTTTGWNTSYVSINGDGSATASHTGTAVLTANTYGYCVGDLVAGDDASLSFFYRNLDLSSGPTVFSMSIRWYNSSNTIISQSHIDLLDLPDTNVWQRMSDNFTVPANYYSLSIDITSDALFEIDLKHIQIEKKPFATSFVDGTRNNVGTNFLHYPHGIDITKDFTVAFWVRPPVPVYHATETDMVSRSNADFGHSYGYAAILDFDPPSNHRFDLWWHNYTPYTGVLMSIQATSGTTDSLHAGIKTPEAGDDVLIVITGSSNTITIYCGQDGEVDSDSGTYYGVEKSTHLYLGGYMGSTTLYYSSSSMFDEVLILDYVVDEETIKTWAKNPAPFTSENQDIIKAKGRVIIDDDSLKGYNAAGDLTFELGAEEGDAWFSGDIEASSITGSTLQTADTGQRVVISSADNTLRFYNASGEAVKIDDSIFGGKPGIILVDGVFYNSNTAGSLSYMFPSFIYVSADSSANRESSIKGQNNSQRSGNVISVHGETYDVNSSGGSYYRFGLYGYANVNNVSNNNIPVGVYGNALTSHPTQLAYAGYFDNGLVYIKENLLIDGTIIGQGAISGASFQLDETEIIDSTGFATDELKTRSYLQFGYNDLWTVENGYDWKLARTVDSSDNTQGYRMIRGGKVTGLSVQYRCVAQSGDSGFTVTVRKNGINTSMNIAHTHSQMVVSDNIGGSTTSNSFTFVADDRISIHMGLEETQSDTLSLEDIVILVEIST